MPTFEAIQLCACLVFMVCRRALSCVHCVARSGDICKFSLEGRKPLRMSIANFTGFRGHLGQ